MQFDHLDVTAAHLGLIWQKYRDRFPIIQEKPELESVIERFGPPAKSVPGVRFEVWVMPIPRYWFVSASGNELVQVQRNRFIRNWRKTEGGPDYPSYEKLRQSLLERPGRATESLLSDQSYRGRAFDQRTTGRSLAPLITMEASQPFRVPFGEGVFEFEQEPPSWFRPLLNQVCAIGNLPCNWDSYGARPIDPETAVTAMGILLGVMSADDPHPSVVPTSSGGVMVEWHEGGVDLEVDVRSPTSIHVYFEADQIEEEFENSEFEVVMRKLSILRDRLQFARGNG